MLPDRAPFGRKAQEVLANRAHKTEAQSLEEDLLEIVIGHIVDSH
jgi:hypothetical protein